MTGVVDVYWDLLNEAFTQRNWATLWTLTRLGVRSAWLHLVLLVSVVYNTWGALAAVGLVLVLVAIAVTIWITVRDAMRMMWRFGRWVVVLSILGMTVQWLIQEYQHTVEVTSTSVDSGITWRIKPEDLVNKNAVTAAVHWLNGFAGQIGTEVVSMTGTAVGYAADALSDGTEGEAGE